MPERCRGGHAAALLLFLSTSCPGALAGDPVSVSGAWIRQPPPVVPVAAGYLVLENTSETGQRLTGVSSPRFARIEIHRSEIRNGTATMRPQDEVGIPAHGMVRFEPGGLHLMMFDPDPKLENGEDIELTLAFADGSLLSTTASVRHPGDADPHHH